MRNNMIGVSAERIDFTLAYCAAFSHETTDAFKSAWWHAYGWGLALAAGRIEPGDAAEAIGQAEARYHEDVLDTLHDGLRNGMLVTGEDWPDAGDDFEPDFGLARKWGWLVDDDALPTVDSVQAARALLERASIEAKDVTEGMLLVVPFVDSQPTPCPDMPTRMHYTEVRVESVERAGDNWLHFLFYSGDAFKVAPGHRFVRATMG